MKTIPKRWILIVALAFGSLLPMARAEHSRECRQADRAVSFRRDVLPALQSKCMACHFDSETPPGLNFSSEEAYANLVGRNCIEVPNEDIVKPGDPAQSYLIKKISEKPA